MKKIEITTKKQDRILKILEKECSSVVYSAFVRALRQKDILVNGVRIKDNVIVPAGSRVTAFVADDTIKKIPFEIVYEDEKVLFINKGAGIESSDGEFNVVDELAKRGKEVFAVHRLDRNTLGLLVFAKNIEIQKQLISAFKAGKVEKLYYAEVVGEIKEKHAVLKGFLEKNKDESVVKIYLCKKPNSVAITTEYSVVKQSGNTALLSIKIKEGKTHQIRAHLAFNKIFIIGDGKYGKNEINDKFKAKTQHLKAYKIKFNFENTSNLAYLNNLNLQLDSRF